MEVESYLLICCGIFQAERREDAQMQVGEWARWLDENILFKKYKQNYFHDWGMNEIDKFATKLISWAMIGTRATTYKWVHQANKQPTTPHLTAPHHGQNPKFMPFSGFLVFHPAHYLEPSPRPPEIKHTLNSRNRETHERERVTPYIDIYIEQQPWNHTAPQTTK